MGRKVYSPRRDKNVFKQTLRRQHKGNFLTPRNGVRK